MSIQSFIVASHAKEDIAMSKVWLITGSGNGLGRDIAEAALAAGDRVVAGARRTEELASLAAQYGDRVRPACTTTGRIPTASSSRRPTPTCGEARRATPTPSRVSPMARPTLTWSSYAKARTLRDGCSPWSSGPSGGAFWK